jgi:hypothetical protein
VFIVDGEEKPHATLDQQLQSNARHMEWCVVFVARRKFTVESESRLFESSRGASIPTLSAASQHFGDSKAERVMLA